MGPNTFLGNFFSSVFNLYSSAANVLIQYAYDVNGPKYVLRSGNQGGGLPGYNHSRGFRNQNVESFKVSLFFDTRVKFLKLVFES